MQSHQSGMGAAPGHQLFKQPCHEGKSHRLTVFRKEGLCRRQAAQDARPNISLQGQRAEERLAGDAP